MTKKESMLVNQAVSELDNLNDDAEIDHEKAEDTLLELIESLTGCDTVTMAFKRAKSRVPFWYA